jgi:hypothetical protein
MKVSLALVLLVGLIEVKASWNSGDKKLWGVEDSADAKDGKEVELRNLLEKELKRRKGKYSSDEEEWNILDLPGVQSGSLIVGKEQNEPLVAVKGQDDTQPEGKKGEEERLKEEAVQRAFSKFFSNTEASKSVIDPSLQSTGGGEEWGIATTTYMGDSVRGDLISAPVRPKPNKSYCRNLDRWRQIERKEAESLAAEKLWAEHTAAQRSPQQEDKLETPRDLVDWAKAVKPGALEDLARSIADLPLRAETFESSKVDELSDSTEESEHDDNGYGVSGPDCDELDSEGSNYEGSNYEGSDYEGSDYEGSDYEEPNYEESEYEEPDDDESDVNKLGDGGSSDVGSDVIAGKDRFGALCSRNLGPDDGVQYANFMRDRVHLKPKARDQDEDLATMVSSFEILEPFKNPTSAFEAVDKGSSTKSAAKLRRERRKKAKARKAKSNPPKKTNRAPMGRLIADSGKNN